MDPEEPKCPLEATAESIAAARARIAEKWKPYKLLDGIGDPIRENEVTMLENQEHFHLPENPRPRYTSLQQVPVPTGNLALGARDNGVPEVWETKEQYYRRTGKGFYLGQANNNPDDQITRQAHESNAAYAARLRAIANRIDPYGAITPTEYPGH